MGPHRLRRSDRGRPGARAPARRWPVTPRRWPASWWTGWSRSAARPPGSVPPACRPPRPRLGPRWRSSARRCPRTGRAGAPSGRVGTRPSRSSRRPRARRRSRAARRTRAAARRPRSRRPGRRRPRRARGRGLVRSAYGVMRAVPTADGSIRRRATRPTPAAPPERNDTTPSVTVNAASLVTARAKATSALRSGGQRMTARRTRAVSSRCRRRHMRPPFPFAILRVMATLLPSPCLVVLVGASGAGKSTWAAEHFAPDQVVSSDRLRAVVGEGEEDLAASEDAFALLDQIVEQRSARRLTTVVDTLGLDPTAPRRAGWRWPGGTAVATACASCSRRRAAECRARNRARGKPVPDAVLVAAGAPGAASNGLARGRGVRRGAGPGRRCASRRRGRTRGGRWPHGRPRPGRPPLRAADPGAATWPGGAAELRPTRRPPSRRPPRRPASRASG